MNALTQLQLKVTAADGQRLHMNWGYTLYGLLCAQMPTDYVEELHNQNTTPISQYLDVAPGGQEAYWRINALDNAAINAIEAALAYCVTLDVQHHQTTLQILDKQWLPTLSEESFCRRYLVELPPKRRIPLEFITPTSFKSQGNYQLFPSVEWILKSLWSNWQTFAKQIILDGDDVRDQLIQYTHISDYQLKSIRFPLKGQQIPAFKGRLTLAIAGPDPLARLVNLLLAFSQYSGIGIKTALGMGGCRIPIFKEASA